MGTCLLCKSNKVSLYRNIKSGTFFSCDICSVVYRDQKTFLDSTSEKSRYDKHKNDIDDLGFQNSVKPIVKTVLNHYTNEARGLDYGCGNGPVAAALLEKEGFDIALYDPFYAPDKEVLQDTYDFIICNEVIEHFYNPKEEFETFAKLLKPSGLLICGTGILYPTINFDTWFYKNDPTHVIFYTTASLEWIQKELSFSSVSMANNLVVFQA